MNESLYATITRNRIWSTVLQLWWKHHMLENFNRTVRPVISQLPSHYLPIWTDEAHHKKQLIFWCAKCALSSRTCLILNFSFTAVEMCSDVYLQLFQREGVQSSIPALNGIQIRPCICGLLLCHHLYQIIELLVTFSVLLNIHFYTTNKHSWCYMHWQLFEGISSEQTS